MSAKTLTAEFLKERFPNRADSDTWQVGEYRHLMNRDAGPDVEIGLTLKSGARELRLTGAKPIKAGLLKAFVK